MLHLIPAPLHRQLYRIAYRVRHAWWRVRPPRRAGVVVVAFDAHGRVLLVRHSYGPRVWTLPGGGINRREHPEQAAVREMREELGCGVTELAAVDLSAQPADGAGHPQYVFAARLAGEPAPDMREITAIALVDPAALPEPCGRRSRWRIAQAVAQRARSQQR